MNVCGTNEPSAVESAPLAIVVRSPEVRSCNWTRALALPPTLRSPPIAALRANERVACTGEAFVQVKLGDVQVLVPAARPPSRPPSDV